MKNFAKCTLLVILTYSGGFCQGQINPYLDAVVNDTSVHEYFKSQGIIVIIPNENCDREDKANVRSSAMPYQIWDQEDIFMRGLSKYLVIEQINTHTSQVALIRIVFDDGYSSTIKATATE